MNSKYMAIASGLLAMVIANGDVSQASGGPTTRPDYSITGLSGQTIARFLEDFRLAVSERDIPRTASMIRFPLRVTRGGKTTYLVTDEKALSNRFEEVFDSSVRRALKSANQNNVMTSWRGISVGNGSLWIDPNCADTLTREPNQCQQPKVFAVNSDMKKTDGK